METTATIIGITLGFFFAIVITYLRHRSQLKELADLRKENRQIEEERFRCRTRIARKKDRP